MGYNKETDYQAKINEAVKSGDYESAALYEKQRNEKIDGEKLAQEKTNYYTGWLDKTDYSVVIKDKINKGASRKSVSDSLKDRIEKASGTIGLTHYAYDDVYDEAIKYITGGDNYSYRYEENPPEYESEYEGKIDSLYNQLINMKNFSYDLESDDLYKYYKEQYNREGKRAMQDLLGVLSMNTGGVPSSYAVSAAGQVLDLYNEKLTDKIPELYEAAYDRYMDSWGNKRENLKLMSDIESDKYDRYLDKLEQYNKDREADYRAYTDMLDREYDLQKLELDKEVEASESDYLMRKLFLEEEELNNKKLFDEKEYENEKLQQEYENEQQKIETALKKWKQLGYLDEESAQILGLNKGLRTADYNYKMSK